MSLNEMRFKIIGLILVIGIFIGLGGIVASDNRPPIGQAPPINDSTSPKPVVESENEAPQKYTITASSVEAVNTSQLAEYGEVGTQAGERIEVTMSPTNVGAVENISWITNVRPVIKSKSTNIPGSSDGESLGVETIHQNGITGDGAKVGVIDGGFDTDNPAISSNIVDTKSFRETKGDPAHGTSVAETVIRTAPDSQLHLTSTSTGTDTEAAIEYLSGQNVDIIVHSAGFPAIEDDGEHFLTDDITKVTKNRTLFVNSAGNDAQLHWEGNFRDNDLDDFHEWSANGDEQNCIPNCNLEYSGDIDIFIRWDNTENPQSHYRPILYNPISEEYIAVDSDGVSETGYGTSYTRLNGRITQSQAVDLVVDRVEGSPNDEIEIIVAGPQEIEHNVSSSSITAPGDVPEALTVAAYQRGISRGLDGRYPRQLASYSSRGPTDDGRTGIDVTGYTNIRLTNNFYDTPFGGTSAAAPYVGGVAALVHEKQPTDPSPTELTNTLKSSSDDILDPGIDTSSGSGVVNAANAVDTTDNRKNWTFDTANEVPSSPTVVNGTVYIGSYDNNLYAMDSGTGNQQWEFQTGGSIVGSPNVVDGKVYIGSADGHLYAIDAESGNEYWSVRFANINSYDSSPTIKNGTVFVGNDNGNLYAVDAENGNRQWIFQTDNQIESSPTIINGTVFVGVNTDGLYALDANTGEQQWAFDTDITTSSPTVTNNRVLIAGGNTLYSLNATSGELAGSVDTSGTIQSTPTVDDNTVFINSDRLLAINDNGNIQWEFDVSSASSPTVVNGTVFIGAIDKNLYAVDAETGNKKWAYDAGSEIRFSSPTVINGTVYIGSQDGTVHAIDADITGSSEGSRVNLGTLGHHKVWAERASVDGDGGSKKVALTNVELSQNSISNNSESDRTLTFDALNISSDGQQDNFTVTMPQSVELVAVTDVAVTNGNYDVSYSNTEDAIQFHVDPNRDVDSVDLAFEVDMTLTGRG